MNRITVILLAALDAVIALGVGVAIPLVPLTVMWGLQFDLSSDWLPFWRGGADIWLLGQGVDDTVTLDPTASATFGLSGTNVFTISTAALGLAVLTVFLGSRTGRRAWATPHALAAAISGIVTFAVLSALVTLSAHTGAVVPSLLQGAVLPACVFAVGIGVGIVAAELRDRADPARGDALGGEHPQHLPWPASGWSPSTRAVLAAILRGGMAASALVVAASAVFLTVLMVIGYGRIVGLYETLQPGVLGAGALTLAQLALLPNAVIWAASWLAGPGFAIGAGSSVDVAQTTLGPLPSVPLFGVLPQSDPGFGLAAVLVPVLCGAVAGFLLRRWIERMSAVQAAGRVDGYRAGARAGVGGVRGRLEHGIGGRADGVVEWGAGRLALVVLGMGVCSGAVLGLLAWWSSGAIGPGRLQHAGPNPLLVAAAVAAEVVIGAGIGIAVRRESALEPGRIGARERRERTIFIPAQTALSSPAEPRGSAAGGRRSGGRAVPTNDDDKDWIAALDFDDEPPEHSPRETSRSTASTRGRAAPKRAGSASGRPALGGSAAGDPGLGASGLGASGLGVSGLGGSGLVRPSAPRVPTPRGRLPKVARERDFAEPEFASHETSESDDR
jgi:hypothetical protein